MSFHPAVKSGNVAVITGAGYGGIGFALAATFAKQGLKLALVDVGKHYLDQAVSELGLSDSDVLAIQADASKYNEMAEAANQVKDKFGKVNVLCLNAGIGPSGATTWNGKLEIWAKMLDVNLWGVINGSNAFVQDIVDGKDAGLVIVTGSKQGITAPPGNPAYNVSKAAVKMFTEQMAHELREATGKRVTAHLLVPGWTFTKLTSAGGEKREKPAGAWTPQQVVDYAMPRIAKGDFYIICPDNDVTSDLDQARMEWSANDVAQNRPALSRWSAEHKDEFAAFIKERTKA